MSIFSQDKRRQGAFSSLVRLHGAMMMTVARRQVGVGDAEDAVQAALLSAWKQFRVSEVLKNPRAWLLRFIVNECRNVVGRRARRSAQGRLEEEQHPSSSEDIVATLQRALIEPPSRDPGGLLEYLDEGLSRAGLTTTEDERLVLLLRAVGELSYKEIAIAMEVPIGTVMSRLCRAREKVRQDLERQRSNSDSAASFGRRCATTQEICPSDSTAR